MTLVTALIVGYLGLSLIATVVLISACVVGGRFEKANKFFGDPVQQSNSIGMMTEVKAEKRVEAKGLIPQLIRQVTE